MKIVSMIVLGSFVLLYSLWGVFDYGCATTSDLRLHREAYVNSKVTLSNVSVLSHRLYESKKPGTAILELDLWNGYSKPLATSLNESLRVYGNIASRSELLTELGNGVTRLSSVRVDVNPKATYLTGYQINRGESWLTTPYQLSQTVLNYWLSLRTSTLIALVLQALVIGVIVKLVFEGLVFVLPGV